MSGSTHQDRRRAESFGTDAEQYDRARPGYPAALVDDLLAGGAGGAGGAGDVLDVGCGTAKAGRLFADRGCRVLGVEPDARMAAVARRHGVAVEVAAFEDWQPAGRRFDLVIAGQSWHWVDPVVGPRRAGELLRPGGRLAVFWNLGDHDAATTAAFDEVYGRMLPARVDDHRPGPPRGEGIEPHLEAVRATGLFAEPEVRSYEWDHRYSKDEWLDQLPTHSDHRVLPPDVRAAAHAAIGDAIDRLGGSVPVYYETVLMTAVRRPVPAASS